MTQPPPMNPILPSNPSPTEPPSSDDRHPSSSDHRDPPTLAQLLKQVSDVRKMETGDQTPTHNNNNSPTLAPLLPFVLSFTDLSYTIRLPPRRRLLPFRRRRTRLRAAPSSDDEELALSHTKTLLDGVSGEARDGDLLAVLGASGSGKSTLIDALANRIAKGRLKGTLTLNGEPLDSRLLKVISAYVMQDDLLYPMLTVEETLMFAAEFRLPPSLSRSKKSARVHALIHQLGLASAANTVIGDEGHRGVSGGERRRVSIGIDVIHDPIILFLDEPTSGLDSTSAFMVVKVLQRIAKSGSIVIMSIHQPSNRILTLLDHLIFLSHGQTAFSGPPADLPLFFSQFGHQIPENENLTEFALDFIRELDGSRGGRKKLVEFNKEWQQDQKKNNNPNRINDQQLPRGRSLKQAISASISRGKLVSGPTSEPGTRSSSSSSSMVPTFANPFWIELMVLSRRSLKNSMRMPELFGVRLGAIMVTGFILATMFWKLDESPMGVQERLGFFAFAMSTTFYTCAETLPVFLQERYIFMRETAHNAYRRCSYVISHTIVTFPPLLILSAAFAVVTFWSVGLAGGGAGFLYYFCIILASFWAGTAFVTFLSGVVPQVIIGYTTVVAILAYFLLFSGFFINRDRIPDYWIWFHYMSLVKYPYEGVLRNEFGGESGRCFVRGVQMFDGTPLEGVAEGVKVGLLSGLSGTLGRNINATSCITTGRDILERQKVTDLSKWACLWVTVGWGFFFRVLFYLSLVVGSKNKRR